MRILISQDTDWLTRYPGQQHHLAEMLSLRGHDIRVIDYEIQWRAQGRRELYSRREVFNSVPKIHDGACINVIRPGIIKIPWLDYVSVLFSHKKEFERQVREFVPDIIVGFSILGAYLASRTAKKNSIPFIYYWTDVQHMLVSFKPFQAIAKNVERRIFKHSDRMLVINDELKSYVVEMGSPPERTQVLRAGIDVEQFDPADNGEAVRKQYGLKKEDIVLFFMGWLYHFSGLKEVALRLTEIKDQDLKLLVVGEGDAYNWLQEIRDRHNLQHRIILTGKKSYQEIPAFIAAADICLLPAYPTEKIMQHIVPIKMYEYMAMKKPVIATRIPGVVKEFDHGNGVVYVDGPEEVIGKAIELISNGNLGGLGSQARAFAEKHSWEEITNDFEVILKDVFSSKQNAFGI